jgi:hypothetical protein
VQEQPTSMKPAMLAFGGILLFAAGVAVGLLVSRFPPAAVQPPAAPQPAVSEATPEDKLLAIADAKQLELKKFLDNVTGAGDFLSEFKVTIAEEKEDVRKRAQSPYTGKFEFSMGVGKRVVSPDGKGHTQTTCTYVALYSYNKKEKRWTSLGSGPIPANYAAPDQIVDFRDVARIFSD